MDPPDSKPNAGVHSNEDSMDSEQNCSSLARSDSGQGKSIEEDYISQADSSRKTKILESASENDDPFEKEEVILSETSNANASACCDMILSHTCVEPDYRPDKSPTFSNFTLFPINQINSTAKPKTCSNDVQGISSEIGMLHKKQQKDNFEGCVSDLSSAGKGRSEKASLVRQTYVDNPLFNSSLDINSFNKDQPLDELYNCETTQSPNISILSSRESANMCCHHDCKAVGTAESKNLATGLQKYHLSPWNDSFCGISPFGDNVNGYLGHYNYVNQCGGGIESISHHLRPCLPPQNRHVCCHILPHGMVPKMTFDNVVKELIFANKKILELQQSNSSLLKDNAELRRQCTQTHENEQLQLHHYEQSLAILQGSADYWKNLFIETKDELEKTKREIKSKQQELHSYITLLESLDAASRELELKGRQLQSLQDKCQELQFKNEGLMKQKEEASGDTSDQLQAVVHLRPMNNQDETQPKRM